MKSRSERLVEFADHFVDLRLQLGEFPGLVLLLQFLAGADEAEEQTEVDSFFSGGQSALPGLNLHVVEVDQLLNFHAHRVGDVLLDGLGLCVDVGHHDDVLVGHFPEGFLLLLGHLVGGHPHVVF